MMQTVENSANSINNVNSNGFKTVNESVRQLPDAIGGVIYNLVVPSDDALDDLYDDFNNQMQQQLGAAYEITTLGADLMESVQNSSQTETVSFPGISVPVGDGQTFDIASAQVSIFPGGLEVLQNCIKFIVTAALVALWLLGLQYFFHKFVGGGDNTE